MSPGRVPAEFPHRLGPLLGHRPLRHQEPFLTAAAADWLVERQAALVGIDSVNIDDTSGPARPVHTALLAAGIPIVEHLCGLDQLPPSGFRFHAAPAPVVGIGTFPVRAYAVIADGRDLHVA